MDITATEQEQVQVEDEHKKICVYEGLKRKSLKSSRKEWAGIHPSGRRNTGKSAQIACGATDSLD